MVQQHGYYYCRWQRRLPRLFVSVAVVDAVGNAASATHPSLATLPWSQAGGTAFALMPGRFGKSRVNSGKFKTTVLKHLRCTSDVDDEFARFESGYWSGAKVAGNLQHVAKHYIYVRPPPLPSAFTFISFYYTLCAVTCSIVWQSTSFSARLCAGCKKCSGGKKPVFLD